MAELFLQPDRPWRPAGVPYAMGIGATGTVRTASWRLMPVARPRLLSPRARPSGRTSFISNNSSMEIWRSFFVASIVGNDESVSYGNSFIGMEPAAYIKCSPYISSASYTNTADDSGSLRRTAGAPMHRGEASSYETSARAWFPWRLDSSRRIPKSTLGRSARNECTLSTIWPSRSLMNSVLKRSTGR